MKLIGNIIWVLFGGIFVSIGYVISSFLLMITIIGIPFGIQTIKLAFLALWPFGKKVIENGASGGCLSIIMNVFWLIFGGFGICLSHLFLGLLFCLTIIGIPFGKQHFKLAGLALTPFGKTIV